MLSHYYQLISFQEAPDAFRIYANVISIGYLQAPINLTISHSAWCNSIYNFIKQHSVHHSRYSDKLQKHSVLDEAEAVSPKPTLICQQHICRTDWYFQKCVWRLRVVSSELSRREGIWVFYLFPIPHEDVCSISQPNAIQCQLIS